jgi:hypothetical protein
VRSLARLRVTGGAKPFPSKDFTPAKRASTLSRHASTTLLRLVVGQRPNAESGLIVIHGREPGNQSSSHYIKSERSPCAGSIESCFTK